MGRAMLVLGFARRTAEIALLYGHFVGSLLMGVAELRALELLSPPSATESLVGVPLYVVMALLWLLCLAVFVHEMRVHGSPHIAPLSRLQSLARSSLRLVLYVAFGVVALSSAASLVLSGINTANSVSQGKSQPIVWLQFVTLSALEASLVLVLYHLTVSTWRRRSQHSDLSFFQSLPAKVQHMLPSQHGELDELSKAIRLDSWGKLLMLWSLGLSVALYGDARLLELTGHSQEGTGTFEILALVLSLLLYLLVAGSLTVFFVRARKRELAILEGTYAATRNRAAAIFFAVILILGAVWGVASLISATYYLTLKIQNLLSTHADWKDGSALVMQEILRIWPLVIFFLSLMLETLVAHLRNSSEQLSVITRSAKPLDLSVDFAMPEFSYASLDGYEY